MTEPRKQGACGCNCVCHEDEVLPEWPGSCAACCEPGMNCDCGRALLALIDATPARPDAAIECVMCGGTGYLVDVTEAIDDATRRGHQLAAIPTARTEDPR